MTVGAGTRVVNTEVFGTGVNSQANFGTVEVRLAPATIGGWLSTLATCYSKFKWHRLRVIYVPSCSTSLAGSLHIGLQYDITDALPTTVSQMSMLDRYVTGPVWSGYQVAPALQRFGMALPPGSLAVDVPTGQFAKKWYPVASASQITSQTTISSALGNEFVPVRAIVGSADGPSSGVAAGRIYLQYDVEFIEPDAPATNT